MKNTDLRSLGSGGAFLDSDLVDSAADKKLSPQHADCAQPGLPNIPLPFSPICKHSYRERLLKVRPAVLESLSWQASDRVSERYITAINALCQSSRGLVTWPAFRQLPIDQYANELVVNCNELRRALAVSFFSTMTSRRIQERQTMLMKFPQIIGGLSHVASTVRIKPEKKCLPSPRLSASGVCGREFGALLGENVREVRETLAGASFSCFQEREKVFNLLRGEERISSIREEGLFEDCEGVEEEDDGDYFSVQSQDLQNDNEFYGSNERNAFSLALRQLPEGDHAQGNFLSIIARRVEDYAFCIRRVPVALRPEHAIDFLQALAAVRTERDSTVRDRSAVSQKNSSNRKGMNSERILNQPSDASFRMAMYRTEALTWMAQIPFEEDLMAKRKRMKQLLSEFNRKRCRASFHPMVWRVLIQAFDSIDALSEDDTGLRHFVGLMGTKDYGSFRQWLLKLQTDRLLSKMVVPDRALAEKLVAHFCSARRSLRASHNELEWIFGTSETAHRVSQYVHGYHQSFYLVLAGRLRLPYLVARVLRSEFGDLRSAQSASFTRFVHLSCNHDAKSAFQEYELAVDERLDAYRAVNEERDRHCREGWGRFDASWGLFREICMGTKVRNCIQVTTDLLDEKEEGTGVLRRLATESLVKTCRRSPALNTDDALRLRTFAYSFVASEGPKRIR